MHHVVHVPAAPLLKHVFSVMGLTNTTIQIRVLSLRYFENMDLGCGREYPSTRIFQDR